MAVDARESKEAGEALAPLSQVPPHLPEAPQRGPEPERNVEPAPRGGAIERRAEVVVVRGEGVEKAG